MLFLNLLLIIMPTRMLLEAASDLQPIGSVDVFYGNDLPSLETFGLASDVLEGYQGIYTVEYHLISEPWSCRLLQNYGIQSRDLCFAVAVNGSCEALIEGDTVVFRDLPARMHGTGGPEGEWTLGQLETVLRNASLLIGGSSPGDPDGAHLADRILEEAVSYLGTPYVWGGTDGNGFDCSGLTYRVFNDNGIPLPRTVGAIEEMGVPVEREDLLPGDILIFDNPRHAGIYMGNGEFIHCSSWQDRGVVITPLSSSNYARRYSSAVRILGTGPDY
ncbi:MAG: C40 family peptidase [Candidatus Fermentibacteraceae bacterium]|nr:C40 family peptidase [Candidatus Fermentibacteraceae bacterium]MBN2608474.1 C40 family peptidase [Candidatus Fermentibacteraceae bacterium]